MGQVYAVFRNTFLETVRQPVYALVMVVSSFMIATSPALAAHIYTFGAGSGMEQSAERMIADLGLATMLLAGMVLAVFSTSNVINREITNRTALTVLTKQISRTAFIFGKYAGVAAAITIAATVNTVVILLTIRTGVAVAVSDPVDYGILACMILAPLVAITAATLRNYFRGRAWIGSFTLSLVAALLAVFAAFSLFDKDYTFVLVPAHSSELHADGEAGHQVKEETSITYDWDVARSSILTLEAVLIIAGVSVAASTRLGTGGNFIVTSAVFLMGLVIEYFHTLAMDPAVPDLVTAIADLWYTVVPNLQPFWMSDAITREQMIPWDYMLYASCYAASYILAMLFAAAFLFQKREIS